MVEEMIVMTAPELREREQAAYRRALEDAADEQERLSTGPRAMGSKAVQFKRMLFAEWLRARAAAADPTDGTPR